jgi:hypothetical protein
MKSVKRMYEDLTTEPTRPSLGHSTKAMNLADKMFEVPKAKKMAKGGVTRADGCITKGHTRGKMV